MNHKVHPHRVVTCLGGWRTRLEEREPPVPGDGEFLLRMRVSGLCGTDLFKLETGTVLPGTVLGHEIVGEVVASGSGAAFRVGDRVVVPHHVPCGECHLCRRGSETMCEEFRINLLEPGGFAECVLVRRRAAAGAARRVPDGRPDESMVFLEPAACVLRGLHRSGLVDRGVAVIQGAGSMGLLHLLVLRALFPEIHPVVVDTLEERRQLAERLGAHRSTPPGDAASAVRELSSGIGADAVFDTVGGAALLESALGLCRPGGTVVLFAHATTGERAQLDLNHVFRREKRVVGTYSGTLREQEEVFRALASGALDPSPLVTHRLPLDRFEEAVDLLRRRQALKVLLTPTKQEDPGSG